MRKTIFVLLLLSVAAAGCGNNQPEASYNPERIENEKHPQTIPDSVPQAGINALKEIKQISNDEKGKVKADQKVLEQSDSQ